MHLQDGVDGQAGDTLHAGNGEAGELAVVEHAAHRLHQLRHLDQPVPAGLHQSINQSIKLFGRDHLHQHNLCQEPREDSTGAVNADSPELYGCRWKVREGT